MMDIEFCDTPSPFLSNDEWQLLTLAKGSADLAALSE
jgi:hypothetical protein